MKQSETLAMDPKECRAFGRARRGGQRQSALAGAFPYLRGSHMFATIHDGAEPRDYRTEYFSLLP